MTQTNSSEHGAKVRFPPPLVFLGCILLGVALQYAVAPARAPVDRAISAIVGILILVAGLVGLCEFGTASMSDFCIVNPSECG
jgi:hypothetical protein